MKYWRHLIFILFTFLFLFYPGDSYYFHIFAYQRALFLKQQQAPRVPPISFPYVSNSTMPEVTAEGVYIADLPTFTPIFQRNAHMQLYPASTTKIITALVVNDHYQPDDVMTVKRGSVEGQIMDLVPGEKMTVENLLYGLLVHSANDAAYVFADNMGYDHFIDLMNKKAQELHMTDTHFDNPAGLDSVNQYTTPFDLALAARELLRNKYLSRFVDKPSITVSDVGYTHFHKLVNVNKLLGEIPGIGGLKTGYTESAGENLVTFYKWQGHQFLIVILKSEDRFSDTKNVVGWIDQNVDYYNLDMSMTY